MRVAFSEGDDQNAARSKDRPNAAVGDSGGRLRAALGRGAASLILWRSAIVGNSFPVMLCVDIAVRVVAFAEQRPLGKEDRPYGACGQTTREEEVG